MVLKQAIVESSDGKKAIPEISYESVLLYECLKELKHEEFVPYSKLSELIGRDIQKHRGNLSTAIAKCRREHIVIATVRNEGVKRLADIEVVRASDRLPKHIKRMVRVERQKLTSVDYDGLPRDVQVMHNTRLSQFGVINFFTTTNASKTIENKVIDAQKQLPVGKTLDIFK